MNKKTKISIDILKDAILSLENDELLAFSSAYIKIENLIFLKIAQFLQKQGLIAYPEFNDLDLVIFDSNPDYTKEKENWENKSIAYIEGKYYFTYDIPDDYSWNKLINNSGEVHRIHLDFDKLTQFKKKNPDVPTFFIYFMGHYNSDVPSFYKYKSLTKSNPEKWKERALSLDSNIQQITFEKESYTVKNITKNYNQKSYGVKNAEKIIISLENTIDKRPFQLIAFILEFNSPN